MPTIAPVDTNMDINTSIQSNVINIKKLIHLSYENPSKETVESALLASLQFFSKHPKRHLFCDEDNFEIAVTTLLIFAYETSKQFIVFEKHLATRLSTCPNCAKKYSVACRELLTRLVFEYKFETSVVNELRNTIRKSTHKRLVAMLYKILMHLPRQESVIPAYLKCFEVEFFNNPWLVSQKDITDPLKQLFNIDIYSTHFLCLDFAPAFIVLLFSDDSTLHIKGKEWFQSSDKKVGERDYLQREVIKCIEKVICRIPDLDENMKKEYWYNFSLLLSRLDSKSYKIPFLSKVPYKNFAEFVVAYLSSPTGNSLPAILKVFHQILTNDASGFFDLISTSPENLMQKIAKQPAFGSVVSYGRINPHSRCSYTQESTDILFWIHSFSRNSPQRLELVGENILPLIEKNIDQIKKMSNAQICIAIFFDILRECMDVDVGQRAPFVPKKKIQQLSKYRHMCNNLATFIISSYKRKKNTPFHLALLEIIEQSIFLDVLSGTPGPVEENVNVSIKGTSLWEKLNNGGDFDIRIATKVLTAITHIVFIVRPPSQKNDMLHVMPQGDVSKKAVKNAVLSLTKIVNAPLSACASVISDNKCFLSLVLNLYSADPEISKLSSTLINKLVSKSTINESFFKLLNISFMRTMRCFSSSVRSLYLANVFSPIMQFAVHGKFFLKNLFMNKSFVKQFGSLRTNENNELYSFWYNTWSLLAIAFGDTPQLTQIYTNDFMVVFMENSLTFADLLTENFNNFKDNLPKSLATPEFVLQKLLRPVVDCIAEMICLLRLKDSKLTSICHHAVMSTLSLVNLYHFRSENVYRIYKIIYNLAVKAKGAGNNLKPEQLSDLLVATNLYTKATANSVVEVPNGNKKLHISRFLQKMKMDDEEVNEVSASQSTTGNIGHDEKTVKQNTIVEKVTTNEPISKNGILEKSTVEKPTSENYNLEKFVVEKPYSVNVNSETISAKEPTSKNNIEVSVEEPISENTISEKAIATETTSEKLVSENFTEEAPTLEKSSSEKTMEKTFTRKNSVAEKNTLEDDTVSATKINTSLVGDIVTTGVDSSNMNVNRSLVSQIQNSIPLIKAGDISASSDTSVISLKKAQKINTGISAIVSSTTGSSQVMPSTKNAASSIATPSGTNDIQSVPVSDLDKSGTNQSVSSAQEALNQVLQTPNLTEKNPISPNQTVNTPVPSVFNSQFPVLKTTYFKSEPPYEADTFFKRVFQWDYYANTPSPVIQSTQEMVIFPNLSVPEYFNDIHHYRNVFEPIIFDECWKQIQREKADTFKREFNTIITKKQHLYDNKFLITGVVHSSDYYRLSLSKTDLLLFDDPSDSKNYCFSKIIHSHKKENEIEVSFLIDTPCQGISNMLRTSIKVTGFQVTNLEKLFKEYYAIAYLQQFNIWKDILNRNIFSPIQQSAQLIKFVSDRFNISLGQADILIKCHKLRGFSVVNG